MQEYTDKTKVLAIGKLIASIYKLLCTYEELNNVVPIEYVDTVISEINSANELLFNGELIYIAIQLNTLKQPENQTHKKVKKITFDCANSLCRIRDVMLNG